MGETGMFPGSDTQGKFGGSERKVEVCNSGGDPVSTSYTSVSGHMYVVRVGSGADRVKLQVDAGRMAKKDKIRSANDSVRRRTRG